MQFSSLPSPGGKGPARKARRERPERPGGKDPPEKTDPAAKPNIYENEGVIPTNHPPAFPTTLSYGVLISPKKFHNFDDVLSRHFKFYELFPSFSCPRSLSDSLFAAFLARFHRPISSPNFAIQFRNSISSKPPFYHISFVSLHVFHVFHVFSPAF